MTKGVKYFVVLRGPKNKPMPMVDEEEELVLFDYEKVANDTARDNLLGAAYGWEVFEWLG